MNDQILERIRELRLAGLNQRAVADVLLKEGVLHPDGNPWTGNRVSRYAVQRGYRWKPERRRPGAASADEEQEKLIADRMSLVRKIVTTDQFTALEQHRLVQTILRGEHGEATSHQEPQ